MNKRAKKMSVITVIALFAVMAVAQTATADSTTVPAKEKLPAFLSEVIGIDLSKYQISNEGYAIHYPSGYGGKLKEEGASFILTANNSKIDVTSVFYNGYINYISIYSYNTSIIYSQPQAADPIEQSRNILERYQEFAANYQMNNPYLSDQLSMLRSLAGKAPQNVTSENIKLEIDQKITSQADTISNETSVIFTYMTNGVEVHNKCMVLTLSSNQVWFQDTLGLFSVANTGISKDEALAIGWKTAQSYEESVTGIASSIDPAWGNFTPDAELNMIPGQIYNNTLNNAIGAASMGNTTRDPLTLYPIWNTVFYFSKSVGDAVGIQVGIWGDTQEIAYCSAYGYLGLPDNNNTTTTPTATASPPNSPINTNEPAPAESVTPWIIIATITTCAVIIAISSYAIKRKTNPK
jgi:hypothetical protein